MQRLHDIHAGSDQVQITSANNATVVTTAAPVAAVACLLSVETSNGRIGFAGFVPTATTGHVLVAAQTPVYFPWAEDIRFLSTAAAAASVLNVTWLY